MWGVCEGGRVWSVSEEGDVGGVCLRRGMCVGCV